MDDTLRDTAVNSALDRVTIRAYSDDRWHDLASATAAEYDRLRVLRADSAMRPLTARMLLLFAAGWRRTDIAEALDVSRVTLNNWIAEHASGGDLYLPYSPEDPRHGRTDLDADYAASVFAPVINKLSANSAVKVSQLGFMHDKFVVPVGFERPIAALWRIAYKSRGPSLTHDPQIAAAGDALDVLISLMLRRGVTNLAIAEAAGVTHRAVLDRMNRARQRGTLVTCDASCESFVGENELFSGNTDNLDWLQASDVAELPYGGRFYLVQLTSPKPSSYWLQTLVDFAGDTAPGHTVTAFAPQNTRLALFDTVAALTNVKLAADEPETTSRLGRLGEGGWEIAETYRRGVLAIPAPLLYTEAAERAGTTPTTSIAAKSHIPLGLWNKYFVNHSLVVNCFDNPEAVELEFKATVKHKDDARTRRGAA